MVTQGSALEAEGVALKIGMELAAMMSFSGATFVSDNAEAIQLLIRNADSVGMKKKWIEDCCRLMETFGDWKLEHVPREANANAAADILVQKARENLWSWNSLESFF
ncbi:hypothetical protein QQ045_021357 [Rhodiola kirilowii]